MEVSVVQFSSFVEQSNTGQSSVFYIVKVGKRVLNGNSK